MNIIIGGGLSGLVTAYRLQQKGIPYKILEARTRIGGRINTVYGAANTPVEMGATWFGHQHKHLIALLDELDTTYFEQYMDGIKFFQPFATSPAQAIEIPAQPPSYRISGGSSQLIDALYRNLDQKNILLDKCVRKIKILKDSIQVITDEIFEAHRIILAIPPKIWSKNIRFTPHLPEDVMQIAQKTHTWMEDSIKVAVVYKDAFWQQQHLSGTLFSNSGPFTECYDHSDHHRSKYALCGFVNPTFKRLDLAERRSAITAQLRSVFGAQAEDFIEYQECIWSQEEHTYSKTNEYLFPHQHNGHPIFGTTIFNDRILVSGSETSAIFPGYMDGAVYAANKTAEKIITSVIRDR